MKNFSELLATDVFVTITVAIDSIRYNGDPTAWIVINGRKVYHNRLSFAMSFSTKVPVLDPIEIEIGMSNKLYNEYADTAVVIKSICIDDFDIVPNYVHLAQYQNERNIDTPTSYLGFNGVWRLSTVEPFYLWHHRVTGQGWLLEPIV
jgi:hypothetical protein